MYLFTVEFHIGGYQVLKKWLSYREESVLGRAITQMRSDTLRTARRLAALRLLGPTLDANFALALPAIARSLSTAQLPMGQCIGALRKTCRLIVGADRGRKLASPRA